ncbi:C-type lectin 4 [Aphelenchoides avenae]|nr:C-type lectin 4 [Aphelenchus avenae]
MASSVTTPKYAFLLAAISAAALAACPRGSVQVGSSCTCYQLPDLPLRDETWDIAERLCAIDGGHVASVRNAFQNSFLRNFTKELNSEFVWLGGLFTSADVNNSFGFWQWSERLAPIYYFNWAPQEPSMVDKTARIAMHVPTGQWYAKSNDTRLQWACRVFPL